MSSDARAARCERQLRLNRLLIISSLGSLAFFLGVIAAQDVASSEAAVSMSDQQDSSTNVSQRPRIRTRSS